MSLPVKPLIVLLAAGLSACLVLGLAFPWLQQGRESARLEQSKMRLGDLAKAAHDFHEFHEHLPPSAPREMGGATLHGWPADLLPFIERAELHAEIDFDRPWYAPANRAAYFTRVPQFLRPGIAEMADADGYALTHYAGNLRVMRPEGGMRLGDIADDASYTLLAGEVAAGLKPWGQPDNLRDPALGLNIDATTFGSYSPRGVQFAMVSGSVRLFAPDVDPRVLRAHADPTDGTKKNGEAGDGG